MIRSLLFLAAILSPGVALAEPEAQKKGVLSFVLENEVLAEQKADCHYSNGFQIPYLWGPYDQDRAARLQRPLLAMAAIGLAKQKAQGLIWRRSRSHSLMLHLARSN
jgi:hypothetical protein